MKILYTAIFGPYDDLKKIQVKTHGWRYICYTDQQIKSSEWEVIQTPNLRGQWRMAKEIKMMTLRGISIYVDASFVPNCDLDTFVRNYHETGKASMMRHPYRNCVYEEIDACIDLSKGERMIEARNHLSSIGVMPQSGLAASGIIIKDRPTQFMQEWWRNIDLCTRDQVSWAIPYHKYKDQCHLFNYDYARRKEFLFIPHLSDSRREKYIKTYESHGYNKLIDCVPQV